MNNFFNNVQSFFHSVTTNDRYATSGTSANRNVSNSYARRTTSGGYGPAAPLTSDDGTLYRSPISEEGGSTNLNNPYYNSSNPSSRNNSTTNLSSSSLNRAPYTPGMRSSHVGNSNIPLQDYSADGAPPPPAPALSWKRIDRWLDANYPELSEEISDEATSLDLNELEADLDCTLPLDVRDSFLIHDGQERGGRPCGLFFNLTLLDLESVSEEWTHWKNTAIKISNMTKAYHANQRAANTPGTSSSHSGSSSSPRRAPRPAGNANGNLSWLDNQESVPEGAIQKVYAHPGWIPLISDFLGNNIGVDLAPGPKGRWGQVILFGREYDRKYVVAPSWAAFLMTFADDLENGNHYIFDETENGELSFRAGNGRLIPYFDVLKSRTERLNRQNRPPPAQQPRQPHPQRAPGRTPIPTGSAAPAGRNLSNNGIRKPAPGIKEGRLISPMNSSTNLPSTGLSIPVPKRKEEPLKEALKLDEPKQAPKQLPKEAPKVEAKKETSLPEPKKEEFKEQPKEKPKAEAKEEPKEESKKEDIEVAEAEPKKEELKPEPKKEKVKEESKEELKPEIESKKSEDEVTETIALAADKKPESAAVEKKVDEKTKPTAAETTAEAEDKTPAADKKAENNKKNKEKTKKDDFDISSSEDEE
jgi:cell wall assembly regulator SMI1